MKKKIAVVFCRMNVGGAEKALIKFLRNIDTYSYDVTLFTLNNQGAFLDQVPSGIHIRYIAPVSSKALLLDDLKKWKIGRLIRGIVLRLMIRFSKNEYEKFALSVMTYPEIKEEFDCAIAYKLGYEDTAMLSNIRARKKCAWIHGEVSKDQGEYRLFRRIQPISKLYCVSVDVKKKVDMFYPHVAYKTEVFYNLIDSLEINVKANEREKCDFTGMAVVTVGRLSYGKGQQMVPQTVRILLDQGYDINWYLVGDGPLRGEVERECEKHNVQDHVILLGTKINPYPYIKNCDIYVQPSFTEGYCTTTVEAKVLCKPIVTTDAPGMREQFVSGENGLIVDAMTPEALAEGIRQLLDHPEMCEKFTNALKNESFDNAKEMQKLYDFIES